MTFYAITLDGALNSLGGSLYSGALLGALVELPAYAEISPRYIAEIRARYGRDVAQIRPRYGTYLYIWSGTCYLLR